jgi:hypothetical protein
VFSVHKIKNSGKYPVTIHALIKCAIIMNFLLNFIAPVWYVRFTLSMRILIKKRYDPKIKLGIIDRE